MMTLRKSNERGFADHGWLKSRHTFSFASYYDPRHMGFRTLRVINDDIIMGGGGFGTHPHNDMEIITYVIDGKLAHKDTLGNAAEIKPFEVQIMTAGTGIAHSEFNSDEEKPVHLLQIWIRTDKVGHKPTYGQKSFEKEILSQKLTLVASGKGDEGAVHFNQDARLYVGRLQANDNLDFPLDFTRHAWVQLMEGKLEIGGQLLTAGDAVAISEQNLLTLTAKEKAHFLVFDLA